MMDPRRLQVFRSVVASGSVQAAAANLGMTSSAVSQHLAALQRETGLVLFERSGRGIVATAAARTLNEHSDDAMSALDRLDDLLLDLREGRTGRLVVGYFSSAGPTWMPELVQRLTEELPGITVELVLTESAGARAQARVTPDLDLVVDPPDAPTPGEGLVRTPLAADPYVALVHEDHPLGSRRDIGLVELRRERWVSAELASNPSHRILVSACAAAGFRPRFPVQAGEQYTAMAFVAAGVGVTVLPGLAATAPPPGVARIPLRPPVPVRHLSVVTRQTGAPNRAAARALELLQEILNRASRS